MMNWLTHETIPYIIAAVGVLCVLIVSISLWMRWRDNSKPKKIKDCVYPLHENKASYEYCSHCGKAISEGKKYCPYCGGHVNRESRYCQWCGARLYKIIE